MSISDIHITNIENPKENLEGRCVYSLVVKDRLSYECKTDNCKYNCVPSKCTYYSPIPPKK
jgi:hypothetical protein